MALAGAVLIAAACGTQNPALESPPPTPTPAATPAPETEPPPSEALDDGRHFGYIRGADGGARTIEFDLAYFLTGETANEAAVEDGAIEPGEDVPNDYYIVNRNPRLRTLPYSRTIEITLVNWPDCCDNPLSGDLGTFVASFRPGADDELYRGSDSQYWITLDGGVVVEVEEQYLP